MTHLHVVVVSSGGGDIRGVGRERGRVGGRVEDVTHVSMLMLLQWPFKGVTMGIQGCSATQPEIRKMEGNIMRRSQLNTVMQEQRSGIGGGKRVGKKGGREGGTEKLLMSPCQVVSCTCRLHTHVRIPCDVTWYSKWVVCTSKRRAVCMLRHAVVTFDPAVWRRDQRDMLKVKAGTDSTRWRRTSRKYFSTAAAAATTITYYYCC